MSTAVMTPQQQQRIEEILRLLDQTPIPADLANRRASPRLRVRLSLPVHLLSCIGTPLIAIHSRNLSTAGIGFVSRRPFRKGELIAVELYFPAVAKLCLACVSFSRYLREGLHEVGAEFQEAMSRDELQSRYLHESVPPSWQALARGHKVG